MSNLEVQASNNICNEPIEVYLQIIKNWLAKQPHLPDIRDETFILRFIRCCKFSTEKTKQKLDSYFSIRTAVPSLFANKDIRHPELQEAMNHWFSTVFYSPLPNLTSDGERVIVVGGLRKIPQHVFNEVVLKIGFMLEDIFRRQERENVVANIYILDAGYVTAAHVAQTNPSLIKKFVICSQKAYPEQIKAIHILNSHPAIEIMYNIAKLVMKEKLFKRLHIHKHDLNSLYKYIPRDILPEEYGGTSGKLQSVQNEWMQKLEEHLPWFKEQEKLKVDESMRPGKPTNYDDLFGTAGSFKQLAID